MRRSDSFSWMLSTRDSHAARWIAAAALLLFAGSTACKDWTHFADDYDPRPTRGILVISLDTLRADHLSAYGYPRETSPFLDELAARGVRFEQAIAQYPSTLTSHMSLFTGLYPGEHGVYPPEAVLSEAIPTLPRLFQAAGYRTGGFTEGAFVAGHFGFDRGFDVFSDEAQRRTDDIERTLARARDFVDRLDPQERFFLFVHTYEIHDPYDPPEPYASMFWDGDPPETFPPDAPSMVRHNIYGGDLPAGTVDYFKALYDGSIRYADDQLRDFFAYLEQRGLTDDLTVVVLSDHGEQFQEHGQFVHADIYQETMRVPLIVLHPELPAGETVPSPVELIDVAPTVLALAGLDGLVPMSGKSLVPDLFGAERQEATAYSENDAGRARGYYVQQEDSLHHVVVHHKPAQEWMGRSFTLDLPDTAESVRLQALHADNPATLSLESGWSRQVVMPAEPAADRFPIPPGKRRRLTVVAEQCTPPKDKSNVCFAFRVLEPEPMLTELFDVPRDPFERNDLSSSQSRLADDMRRLVLGIRHEPQARPEIQDLEQALEERLRALGYL